MIYSQERHQLRLTFIDSWNKYQQNKKLTDLEKMIISIIQLHPEYHSQLKKKYLDKDYENESNPFLHMSMHITLQEQLQIDRPTGIKFLYQKLIMKYQQDVHQLEHAMIECLAQSLWQAQQKGTEPNEKDYMQCLQHLL